MVMSIGSENSTSYFLAANYCPGNPGVFQYFCHRGSVLGVDLKHTAHDMPALSRQKTKKTPWAFNDLRFFLNLGVSIGPN